MDIYTRVHLNYKRYLRDEFHDLAMNETLHWCHTGFPGDMA